MWIRPFDSLEDNSVIEKGIAEEQSMVPLLSTGFGDKDSPRTFDLALLDFAEGTPILSVYCFAKGVETGSISHSLDGSH